MQRLGSPREGVEEYAKTYLELIKAHKGCCDNVWMATMYGFPKVEKHKKYAEELTRAAKSFRENGISVSLQLSNSIGHGEYMAARDCSGLVYDGSPVEKMVGHDGVIANYAFCWHGENFRKYIFETTAFYCEMQPDCVWIDDDLRASNHYPVQFGCFCDDCMKKFNAKNNSQFTRELLVKEITHGDVKWREKWMEFIKEGIYDYTYKLCELIHKISPNSKIGYQYCAHGAYTGYGFDYIFKAMKDATGFIPYSRPGGGAYDDIDANSFVLKVLSMNWQNSMLPDYITNKTPEIECLPHMAFQKTPAGTAFETSLYFANGNTDMSYSDMMDINERLSWYGQLFEEFSINRKYWEKMSEYNFNSYQAGLRFYMSENMGYRKLAENEDLADLCYENWNSVYGFIRDTIPIAYDKQETSVILLHPETAKSLSNEEIAFLLTKNVITDGESLEILKGKLNLGLEVERFSNSDSAKVAEYFNQHKTCPKEFKEWTASEFVSGKNESYRIINSGADLEILGVYYKTQTGEVFDNAEKEYIAECIVKTKQGGTWAILGYRPWKGVISSLRRDQLMNIADYISNNSVAARLNTMIPCALMPRKNKAGKTVCVSVANVSIGKCEKCILTVRNPETENFVYMAQNGVEIKLAFQKQGEDYLIELPTIPAWTVCTVFCV